MLHCHSKVGTTVSKVPLYYKPTYLKMRSRRVWENFLGIFYCLSGLRMENSSLKSTPLLNFLLHLYQAMKTRRHMPFISSTVSGWFLISTSIIWMLQIGPTPPTPPPPSRVELCRIVARSKWIGDFIFLCVVPSLPATLSHRTGYNSKLLCNV